MKYNSTYGYSIIEKKWVPAPRYILRRARILEILEYFKFTKGSILEFGCGPGALLRELSEKGFDCTAIETSSYAFKLAKFINSKNDVRLYKNTTSIKNKKFDYIFAFEVLEHIKNDLEALSFWRSKLRHNGHLLISVPAHMSKWSVTDVWAGHERRYEKIELLDKLSSSGFEVITFESYGFPLANFLSPFRTIMHKVSLFKRFLFATHSMKKNNDMSGIDRKTESQAFPLIDNFFAILTFKLFFTLQKFFLNTDLGNGYIVLARKTMR